MSGYTLKWIRFLRDFRKHCLLALHRAAAIHKYVIPALSPVFHAST